MTTRFYQPVVFFGLLLIIFFTAGCQKPDPVTKKEKPSAQIVSGNAPDVIDVQQVYNKLPAVVMHNIQKEIKLYVDRAECLHPDGGLALRIPTSADDNSYIYAYKSQDDPYRTYVYLVQFIPDRGSSAKSPHFSGRKAWLNLQDWTGYEQVFDNGVVVDQKEPVLLAESNWETILMNRGYFGLNTISGQITINDDELVPEPGESTGTVIPMIWPFKKSGGIPCPDDVNGSGRSNLVGNIVDAVGAFFRVLGSGSGDGGCEGIGFGSAGNYNGPGYGTFPGNDFGHSSSGTWAPPSPEDVMHDALVNASVGGFTSNNQVLTLQNPTVGYLMTVLGLNTQQGSWLMSHPGRATEIKAYMLTSTPHITLSEKQAAVLKHLEMMMTIPGYLNFVTTFQIEYPTVNVPLLNLAEYTFTPGAATRPIPDRNEYLKCFTNVSGATYQVTLAVAQPVPNTRKKFKLGGASACNVGHTFLILSQNVNSVVTTRSIGWYPSVSTTPFNPSAVGVLNNDAGHAYDVALLNNIGGTDFMDIVNAIKNDNNSLYNLNTYNCTNWAYNKVFMHPMDNIDATYGCWPLGYGMNPGDMGQDIRPGNINLYSYQSILTNGNAPSNAGSCP